MLVGHSAGSWIAHGVGLRLIQLGYSPPLKLYVSAFPPPTLPEHKRPWTRCRHMSETGLMEEAKKWGVNPAVFQPSIWQTFGPLFRADFSLFDEQKPMVSAQSRVRKISTAQTTK